MFLVAGAVERVAKTHLVQSMNKKSGDQYFPALTKAERKVKEIVTLQGYKCLCFYFYASTWTRNS